jgi:hypothetical protein
MEYLNLGDNAIASVTAVNGSKWNIKAEKVNDGQYTIDLRKTKLTFNTIASVKLYPTTVNNGFLSILE